MGSLAESLSRPAAPALLASLARLLGEPPESLGRALALALPALAAAIAARADHGMIDQLMPAVLRAFDGGDPEARTLAALDDARTRQDLMADGDALMKAALGAEAGPVTHQVARLSGVKAESAAELLKLAGLLALGAMAHWLGRPPAAQDLADRLPAEVPGLERALPAPLRAALAPLAAEPSPLHGTPAEGAAAAATAWGRWLPWLLAAVAVIVILAGLQRFGDSPESPSSSPPAPPPMVTEVPPETVALPDGTTLRLMSGSAAHELARFLAGPGEAPVAFRFEPYAAAEDGTPDALTAATARDVAAVLAAYPSARITLVGHSHPAEADRSAARAEALARLVAAGGIAPARIASEGRGAAEPIATDETAEGRAQNSRIMLVVSAR